MHKFYIIIFIVVCSCTNSRISKVDDNTIDISLNKEVSIYNDKDYFESKELISLETNDCSLISQVDKILKTENGYVILDKKRKTVLLFCEDGKFFRKIYSVGKGPEEYMYICDIILSPNGGYYCLDNRSKNILEYSSQGDFIEKKSIKNVPVNAVHYFQLIREGVFAFYCGFEEKTFLLYDLEKNKLLDYIEEKRVKMIRTKTPLNHKKSPFIRINESWCFYEKYDNVIYKIDNNKIVSFITLNFIGEHFIDLNVVSNENSLQQNTATILNSSSVFLFEILPIDKILTVKFALNTKLYIALCDLEHKSINICNIEKGTYMKKGIHIMDGVVYSVLNPGIQQDMYTIKEIMGDTDAQVHLNDNCYIEKSCLRKF